MKARSIAMGCAALLILSACGESGVERELSEATEELAKAQEAVDAARSTVEERQAKVAAAEAELTKAERALRESEKLLAQIERRVDRSATDTAVFRSIQKRLLEDDDLENVAIAARVDGGVVSLSGSVPNAKLRNRAVEIARDTPGVRSVEVLIQVETPKVSSE